MKLLFHLRLSVFLCPVNNRRKKKKKEKEREKQNEIKTKKENSNTSKNKSTRCQGKSLLLRVLPLQLKLDFIPF